MPGAVATFEELVATLDYPMFIVTTAVGDERAGCLVGFVTQTSIHPPRLLVCLSRQNRTYRVALRASLLVVHLVPADAEPLAELFGGETGDVVDKFGRCGWRPGPSGAPVVEGLENWFAGTIEGRFELGDHVGFLLAPIDGEAGRGSQPFSFHRARRIDAGHEA